MTWDKESLVSFQCQERTFSSCWDGVYMSINYHFSINCYCDIPFPKEIIEQYSQNSNCICHSWEGNWLHLQLLLPGCATFLQVMDRSTKRAIWGRYLHSQVSLTDTQLSSYFVKSAQCEADGFVSQWSQRSLKTHDCLHGLYLQCGGNSWRLSLPRPQCSLVVIKTLLTSSSCRSTRKMACQE